MDLRWQLGSLKCGEEELRTHFKKLTEICDQLASMGSAITEAEYAFILLRTLPVL
jgi:gag-polypeptide of LTR copia-type